MDAGRWRFDLSEEEQQLVVAARGAPLRPRDVLRAVRRHPGLALRMLRSALDGAKQGAREDPGLAWAVDIERIRRAVPDAALGAGWHGLDEFLEVLLPRVRAETRALELGCGGGRVSNSVAPRVAELVCSDISAEILEEARENLAVHRNVRFELTRGYALEEFASGSFDIVYAHDLFVNLGPDATLALLDAAARKAKPGGEVVASFFTIDRPEWKAAQLELLRRLASSGNFGISNPRPYIAEQIDEWFRTAGMEIVDSGYPGADRRDGRLHYVVVGRS
jgi:SAM-dependent methyltransferase